MKRDYTGAVESQVDMSMLPKVMQVRDFGKVRTAFTFLGLPSRRTMRPTVKELR
jgi:hypothetical protein